MRFEAKNITEPEEWPRGLYASFEKLHREIFGVDFDGSRLKDKKVVLIQLAHSGDDVIGFKIGYESAPREFYSWMGAVALTARNYGVASSLLFAQHDWCKTNGYAKIVTKTKNEWRTMLIMNLRNGFDIIGTEPDSKRGGIKILLAKSL